MRRESNRHPDALAAQAIWLRAVGVAWGMVMICAAGNGADVPGLTLIPCSDAQVVAGLSLYNWVVQPDRLSSTVCGASLNLQFTGTHQVRLQVDTRSIAVGSPRRYPVIGWSIGGGETHTHQLVAGETEVDLDVHVADPKITIFCRGFSPFEDRYSGDVPPNALSITGFGVDKGGRTQVVKQPQGVWLNIGDSIMSGDAALAHGRPPNDDWAAADDGMASYAYLLATHYGYREARLAYGGYDWAGGMANIPALATLIDHRTSTISRLNAGVLSPPPAIVMINLGENGTPGGNDVIHALTILRQRAGRSAIIIVMIPVSQRGAVEISKAFTAYQSMAKDAHAHLLDLGQFTFDTADGQHPTSKGHLEIFHKALSFLDAMVTQAP